MAEIHVLLRTKRGARSLPSTPKSTQRSPGKAEERGKGAQATDEGKTMSTIDSTNLDAPAQVVDEAIEAARTAASSGRPNPSPIAGRNGATNAPRLGNDGRQGGADIAPRRTR